MSSGWQSNVSIVATLNLISLKSLSFVKVIAGAWKILINSAEGGQSSAVDGFAVANYLRNNEKEIFETLVSIPLKFKDNDYTQESIRSFHAPAITLTKDNDLNDIRFSVAQWIY